MADESLIAIGMALNLPPSETEKLDKIYEKIEIINNGLKRLGISPNQTGLDKISTQIDNINTKVKRLNDNFSKIDLSKSFLGFGDVTKYTQGISKMGDEWVKVSQTIKSGTNDVIKITGDLNKTTGEFIQRSRDMTSGLQDAKRATISWTESITTAWERSVQWLISMTALYGTLHLIASAFKNMVGMESASVNIMKVLNGNDQSKKQQASFLDENAISLAKRYGQSVQSVQEAMGNWARQYKDVHAIVNMTNASLLAATATDIKFEDSVRSISAIIAEWGMQTQHATHVVDVLNEMSNRYRITASGLAEGLVKASAGAKTAGFQFEELAAYVTTGIQTLGMEGNAVGTVLTRIFARLGGNKQVKDLLKSLEINPNQSMSKTLDELAAKWEGFTKAEQKDIALKIAGTQHWSRFIGIMNNYDTVLQATIQSFESFNSAQNEVNLMMSTTAKSMSQAGAMWDGFIHKNMAVLGATKGIVDLFKTFLAGLNNTNPAILQATIGFAGLAFTALALWGAIDKVVKGMRAANETVSLLTVSTALLKNPIVALIAIVAALIIGFTLWGLASKGVKDHIDKMNNSLDELRANMDRFYTHVSEVQNLKQKYEILEKQIAKTVKGTKEYEVLHSRLKMIVEAMSPQMEKYGITIKNLGENYQNFGKYIDPYVNALVASANKQYEHTHAKINNDKLEVESERQKTNDLIGLMKKRMSYSFIERMTGNLAATQNFSETADAIWKQKNKGWGEKMMEEFQLYWNPKGLMSKLMKESSAYMDQMAKLNQQDTGALNAYNNFLDQVENVKGGNNNYGSSQFDTSQSKEHINVQMSNFNKEQVEWIRNTALASDVKGNTPADKLQKVLYDFVDSTGKIAGHLAEFNASSEALSQAEQRVTNFNSAIKELSGSFVSLMSENRSLFESFSKMKFDSLGDWEIDFQKSLNGLVKPKNDIEQQVEGLFTNVINLNKDYTDKIQKQVEERYSWMDKADEQIGKNDKYIADVLNPLKSQLAMKIPLDDNIKQALVQSLKEYGIKFTDITEDTVDQLIKLINAKNVMWQNLKVANDRAIEGIQTSGFAKSLLNPDQQKALGDIYGMVGGMVGTDADKLTNAKNALNMAQPKEGSYQEYQLKNDIYNAQLEYQDTIEWTIALLNRTKNEAPALAKNIDVLIAWLNNTLQQSKNQLDKPKNPLEHINDKYKFTNASDYDAIAKKVGQNSGADMLYKVNMDYGKSLDQLKNKARDLIVYLNTLTPEMADYNNTVDVLTQTLQQIDQMEIADKFAETFKVILKGTKNWKEAIMDMFTETRNEGVDKFMNGWMKKLSDITNTNGSSGFKDMVGNMMQSLSETWKEASKAQKIQLAMSAASLFIKNNGSKESYQEQGIVNGASTGASVGGIWGAIIGGVLGFAGGSSQAKKQQKQNNSDLRSSIMDSMSTDSFQAYQDFLEAGQAGFGKTTTKHTLAGITSIFGVDKSKLHKVDTDTVIKKWQDLYANGGINDLANSKNTYLLQTLEKWSKFLDSLNASVSNVASNLENAFQADNYMGFIQNWGQSLEDMTRTALIRGFLAQGPLQTAYQNLSNTIGMAVLDGVLNAEEVSSIKAQGNAIASQMKVLYQSLALVDNMYTGNNSSSSSNTTYTAGSSTPIVYNNYITIQSQAFMGNQDEARTFALWIRDEIVAEESRG